MPERWSFGLDGVLDDLNLLRDGRQLIFLETVELVEAAPGTALDDEAWRESKAASVGKSRHGESASRRGTGMLMKKLCYPDVYTQPLLRALATTQYASSEVIRPAASQVLMVEFWSGNAKTFAFDPLTGVETDGQRVNIW